MWSVVLMAVVLIAAMWLSMSRAVAQFDQEVEARSGQDFSSAPLIVDARNADASRWRQRGPGDWVIDDQGKLTLVEGKEGAATFAVTPVPKSWNHAYRLSFTVDQTATPSGMLLAAVDTLNYLEFRDTGAQKQWKMSEELGGDATERAVIDGAQWRPGDRIEIQFEAPQVRVLQNGSEKAAASLVDPNGQIWVGFFADTAGLTVSGVSLTRM